MDRKSSVEIWRDIEGYHNYQVSNLGRVKSLERNVIKGRGGLYKIEEKILKSRKDKNGYLLINLCKEGEMRSYLVHRLVASAFLDNPNNLPQVNHKDEDKTNNRVENIEYCDRSYNINYGNRNEKMAKSRSIPILQFTKDGEFVRRWDSSTQVEKELGIDNSSIAKCCRGKHKSVGGFIWGYADDYERISFNAFDLEIYRKVA